MDLKKAMSFSLEFQAMECSVLASGFDNLSLEAFCDAILRKSRSLAYNTNEISPVRCIISDISM